MNENENDNDLNKELPQDSSVYKLNENEKVYKELNKMNERILEDERSLEDLKD